MKTVVLGAGLAGMTTAWYLAAQGRAVTVVDRQALAASETSYANAGMIAPGHAYTWASPRAPGILWRSLRDDTQALLLKPRLDPTMWRWLWQFLRNCTAQKARYNTSRKLVLCRYSQAELRSLTQQLALEYELLSTGALYLYRDEALLKRGVANMQVLMDGGMPLRGISREEAIELEPALASSPFAGAILSPTDESGDARMFTRNLAKACEAAGVEFVMGTAIRRIEAQGDRIVGVHTDKGVISGDDYVLAMGCDSPLMSRALGYRLPVYPVKGYSVTFPIRPEDEPPSMSGVDEQALVAWARYGNRLRFTATAEFTGYDRSHTPANFEPMLKVARQLFPNGADYSQPDYWAGLRPMTPEGLPILGKSRHRNLYLNTGHGHMGWTMACGTARVVSDIMAGKTPDIDITGMTLQ
ncbi:FAD-dependent oxidoreductase [Lampropedia aestuarii]|uniref:FAD-dependent oxidoreductase n=1 Tax=Lampropedia aestuarii TaxID=2562762 RepID=A0A4S5BLG6_9BURK|nr:D-amino acid dehydrogenase [Lampropedia aestuarii]THJ33397.1 FAD-dependent oxidoreductase [Lampropedia aestuarii]